MVGKPRDIQNQETVVLSAELMEKYRCKTDRGLAERLSQHFGKNEGVLDATQFSKWRKTAYLRISKL